MVQIIAHGPSTATLRQQALDQGMQQALSAYSEYDKQQKGAESTKRQQAFQNAEMAMRLDAQGVDASPQDILDYGAGTYKPKVITPGQEAVYGEELQGPIQPGKSALREMLTPAQEAVYGNVNPLMNKTEAHKQKQQLEIAKYSRELEQQDLDRKYKESMISNNANDGRFKREESNRNYGLKQQELALKEKEIGVGKKPAQNEFLAAGFAKRARQADSALGRLGDGAGTGLGDRMQQDFTVPLFGQVGLPNEMKSENRQLFEQAQDNFVSAVLRKESGAAISPLEKAQEAKKYFPQPGDGEKVLEQKRQAREQAMANLEGEGGNATGRIATAPAPGSQNIGQLPESVNQVLRQSNISGKIKAQIAAKTPEQRQQRLAELKAKAAADGSQVAARGGQ